MEKLKYLMALLGHILRTMTDMYLHPFSPSWDEELQRLLDEGELIGVNEFTATFFHNGDIFEVWTENRWLAFGDLHCLNGITTPLHLCTRPRFHTMYRLNQAIQAYQQKGDGHV